jgi:hypothetical protein
MANCPRFSVDERGAVTESTATRAPRAVATKAMSRLLTVVDGSLRQQPSTSKHASALDLTAAQACSVPDEPMCSETVVDTDKHSVTSW